MEPWYKVTTPRAEVREGRSFNPDEFAIALEQVVAGDAARLPKPSAVGTSSASPRLCQPCIPRTARKNASSMLCY